MSYHHTVYDHYIFLSHVSPYTRLTLESGSHVPTFSATPHTVGTDFRNYSNECAKQTGGFSHTASKKIGFEHWKSMLSKLARRDWRRTWRNWVCTYPWIWGFISFHHIRHVTISFIRLSSPGQFGFARPRGDQPQHAGADLAHVRGGSAADLHADAERLVPALHELRRVHGSAQEPRGASLWAIDSPLPHT